MKQPHVSTMQFWGTVLCLRISLKGLRICYVLFWVYLVSLHALGCNAGETQHRSEFFLPATLITPMHLDLELSPLSPSITCTNNVTTQKLSPCEQVICRLELCLRNIVFGISSTKMALLQMFHMVASFSQCQYQVSC